MPVRRIAWSALVFALALSASLAGADPSLKYLEGQGDAAFKRGRHAEALRLYERALDVVDLEASEHTRLLAKRSRALREVDQGILAKQRLSHARGDNARALRLDNFEEADLRVEQLQLIEGSSRSLLSTGRTEPVVTFLRGYPCGDSACSAMRARLWRALTSETPTLADSDLSPNRYWRVVERFDSLVAYAPEASELKQSQNRSRAAASSYHSRRAIELTKLPAAAYLHHRLAARYGAPASSESRNSKRAIQAITTLQWRVGAVTDGTCSDFVRRLGAVLPRDTGQPVSVDIRLDRCESGRNSWMEEEQHNYTETVMSTRQEFVPPQQVTLGDGTVVVYPSSTRTVQVPVEVVRAGRRNVVREGDTYFAQGTATIVWAEDRRVVELDVHPRFSGKLRPQEILESVILDCRNLLLAAGTKMAAERANEATFRGSQAELMGHSDVAEQEYVVAVRLLGAVPVPAREYFARSYGLRAEEVMQCLLGK